jgi:hypothetical protein
MFAQWWRDVKVLSTFILQHLPTRTVAASKSHHCANTNVIGNGIATVLISTVMQTWDKILPTLLQNKKSCKATHKPTQFAAHFILPQRTKAHPPPNKTDSVLT